MFFSKFSFSVGQNPESKHIKNEKSIEICVNPYIEGINLCICGSRILSVLYSNIIPKEEYKKFSKYFEIEINTNQPGFPLDWFFQSSSKRFCEEFGSDYSLGAILSIPDISKDASFTDIKEILTNGNLEKGQLFLFCFSLLALKGTQPGVFYYFLPRVQQILSRFEFSVIYEKMSYPSFCMFSNPPIDYLRNSYFDINDFKMIMFELYDYNALEAIQVSIFNQFLFPKEIPDFPASISLINASYVKQLHFLDITSSIVKKCIIEKNLDPIPTYTRVFPSFVPYFLIAYQSIIYKDFRQYSRLINAKLPPSISTEYQERFQNDLKILDFIDKTIGQGNKISLLEEHSLPYILKDCMTPNMIQEIKKTKFFIYSEKDIHLDSDFCFSYFLLTDMINLISESKKEKILSLIDNIKICFSLIKSPSILESVVIDCFSLLFLQSDNKFIALRIAADSIVRILLQISQSNYIKNASMCLQNKTPDVSNISVLIGMNMVKMLKAIYDKRWDIAESFSNASAKYLHTYSLSKAVHSYYINGSLQNDMDQYEDIFYLEMGLATHLNKNALNKSIERFPEFSDLLKQRQNKELDFILNPIDSDGKWSIVQVAIQEFCLNPVHFVQTEAQIGFSVLHEKSKSSFSFFQYLSLYHRCFKQSKIYNGSLEFNFSAALSGPINRGSFDEAMTFANLAKIDIFSYVLNHYDHFELTKQYAQNYVETYPLECYCISQSILSDKIPQVVKYYFDDRNKDMSNAEITVSYVINEILLKNDIPDNIDDYIYRVEHKAFLDEIISNIDKIPENVVYYVLDIIGYTTDLNKNDKISLLRLKGEIRKYIKSSDPIEIITCLFDNQKIDLAEQFIILSKQIVYSFSPLFTYANKIINDIRLLNSFLSLFPEHFISFTSFLPVISSYMVNICPSEYREAFQLFITLPFEIRNISRLDDNHSVCIAFINNIHLINELLPEHSRFFTDQEVFMLLEECDRKMALSVFFKTISKLHMFGNFRNAISQFCGNVFLRETKILKVTSYLEEIKTMNTLNLLLKSSRDLCMVSNAKDQIELFYCFVLYHPFSFSQIPYSFSGDFANIISICFLNDMDNIAFRFAEMFQIDLTQYILHRAYIPMSLGLYFEVGPILSDYVNRFKKIDILSFEPNDPRYNQCYARNPPRAYSKSDHLGKNSPFLLQVFKESMFNQDQFKMIVLNLDLEKLRNGELANLYIYQFCQMILKSKKKSKEYSNNLLISNFISRFTKKSTRISLLVSIGEFSNAYSQLISLNNEEKRIKLFVHSLIGTSICFDQFNQVQKMFIQHDKSLSTSLILWDALNTFAIKHQMHHLSHEVLLFTGRLEEAGLTGISLYQASTALDKKLFYIANSMNSFVDALKYRSQPIERYPPFRPSSSITQYILEKKKYCSTQVQILNFYLSRSIIPSGSIDIINDPQASFDVGSDLLYHLEMRVLQKLIKLTNMSRRKIIHHLFKRLKNKPRNEINAFLEKVQKEPAPSSAPTMFISSPPKSKPKTPKLVPFYEVNFEQDFLSIALMHISQSNNWQLIPSLIFKFASDDMKSLFFIEYDSLTETLLCTENPFNFSQEFSALLSYRASTIGERGIIESFEKTIQAEKKNLGEI